jgi:hypothetical protein
MANFGALTDHFTEITTGLTLKDSSKIQTPKTRADAQDENGDICASTWHGAVDIFDVSCEYELQSSTFNLSTLKLGEIDAVNNVVVDNITVTTSNNAQPRVVISGREGVSAITAPSGFENTFTLPSITITAAFQAQVMGFTADTGSLTDTSFTFTANIPESTDGLGVQAGHGVNGAMGTLTANFVRCPDEEPDWTLSLAGLTEVQDPALSQTEPDAAYHTATGTAEVIVARDATP